MRSNGRLCPAPIRPIAPREFSVRLQGGEVIRLLLAEPDLAAVGERLRYERALIGQIVFDDDGCLETAAALIPGHRIQLVVDPHG